MFVIIPKSIKGESELRTIHMLHEAITNNEIVWNKKRSAYPRLKDSQLRGKKAMDEVYRTLIDYIKYKYDGHYDMDLMFHTIIIKLVSNPDFFIDIAQRELKLVYEMKVDLFTNDNYNVLENPTDADVERCFNEYQDILNNNVENIDKVYLIKIKIDNFTLSPEEKLEIIKYLTK
jgi:serine/threonine-protein kinase RIO1